MRVRQFVWSYVQAVRASNRFGRIGKLRKEGQPERALAVAREGLAILGQPNVIRTNPMESSALMCLTIAVEQLAHELQEKGASDQDLRDCYRILREMADSSSTHLRELRAGWLPYLERRVVEDASHSAE